VCAYNTSGDDKRYGPHPSSSSIDVDVVFVSLQRRNDDVVLNASSSLRYNDV